jgi:hypothetical protein
VEAAAAAVEAATAATVPKGSRFAGDVRRTVVPLKLYELVTKASFWSGHTEPPVIELVAQERVVGKRTGRSPAVLARLLPQPFSWTSGLSLPNCLVALSESGRATPAIAGVCACHQVCGPEADLPSGGRGRFGGDARQKGAGVNRAGWRSQEWRSSWEPNEIPGRAGEHGRALGGLNAGAPLNDPTIVQPISGIKTGWTIHPFASISLTQLLGAIGTRSSALRGTQQRAFRPASC